MRTIRNTFEDKARLVADLNDFVLALEHPLEKEDDGNTDLCIAVRESGARITRKFGKLPLDCFVPDTYCDGTTHETEKLFLDKETRDCIVECLKKRIEVLKREIKEL